MSYRHVFDKIFTEFRDIFRVFVNFAAPRPREISEALILIQTRHFYILVSSQLRLRTPFLHPKGVRLEEIP